MTVSIAFRSIFLAALIAVTTGAKAGTQCVFIHIPKFNLEVDLECSIVDSALVQSELPDQDFFNVPGTCFTIVNPLGDTSVFAEIWSEETGDTVFAEISGIAGLTFNAYPNYSPPSFTAASQISITIDGKYVGSIVTRDAGTILGEAPLDQVAAARLSVAAGTKKLKKARGFIDELGKEFDSDDPALATGKLCGKGLAKSLIK